MATKAKAHRGKRTRQRRLPTMERQEIAAIEELAVDYAATRDERMALSMQEKAKALLLLTAMQEHKIEVYELADGRLVEISKLLKAKVRTPKHEGNGEAGDEE